MALIRKRPSQILRLGEAMDYCKCFYPDLLAVASSENNGDRNFVTVAYEGKIYPILSGSSCGHSVICHYGEVEMFAFSTRTFYLTQSWQHRKSS